jgi:hypothetical protein
MASHLSVASVSALPISMTKHSMLHLPLLLQPDA